MRLVLALFVVVLSLVGVACMGRDPNLVDVDEARSASDSDPSTGNSPRSSTLSDALDSGSGPGLTDAGREADAWRDPSIVDDASYTPECGVDFFCSTCCKNAYACVDRDAGEMCT